MLVGAEAGARQLRTFFHGEPVTVRHRLVSSSTGIAYRFALGGYPVLRDGLPLPGLDTTASAVRTAVGVADGGRRLLLLALDGAPQYRGGLTIAEVADTMRGWARSTPSVWMAEAPRPWPPGRRARAPSPYATIPPGARSGPSRTASGSSRPRDAHGLRPLTMSAVAIRPLLMLGAMFVPAR
ncbi:hypothetical protein SALBM311S_10170 [Streptomyces alboniger]